MWTENSQFHPFQSMCPVSSEISITHCNLPCKWKKTRGLLQVQHMYVQQGILLCFWKRKEKSLFHVNKKLRVSLTSFCVSFSLVEPVCLILQHVEWDSPMKYATHAQVHTHPAVSSERLGCHLNEKMNGGKGEERKRALLPSTFHALDPCT